MSNRQQAIEFLNRVSPLKMRASKAPEEFRGLIRAIHAAYWDEDGNVVREPRAAIATGLNMTFPVSFDRPQRKGSEGCARCGGTGYIDAFAHIHGGKCAACWS